MLETILLLILATTGPDAHSPERRALIYLEREVPLWSKTNKCFSCHNNGDAARALVMASEIPSLAPDSRSLADTLVFLSHPDRWTEHEADSPNKDVRLARLQFTSTLILVQDAKLGGNRAPLVQAAEKLAADQSEDGSWPIESDETPGSPATYGRSLATSQARRTLHAIDSARFAPQVAKADRWLRDHEIRNILDASAILLALRDVETNRESRRKAFGFLLKSENKDGGWGLHSKAAPEPFDTAVTLLALQEWPDREASQAAIKRGRAWLIAAQLEDGSWPETTRPAGGESYAQRLSTAGWATLALLATR